jgi:REP element-mobilizing transposase RayT
LQAVTFRLADSVPKQLIDKWQRELLSISDEKVGFNQLHARIAKYEDAGHGSAILRKPEIATILQDKLLEGHGHSYHLFEWCVMPNHVHVFIRLINYSQLADILKAWKGSSSLEINRAHGRTGTLWQREYHDRFVRDMGHFHDCVAYIRNNPVKSKLCASPEDWLFSSAGSNWNSEAGAPPSVGPENDVEQDAGSGEAD